jgi:hypothetical protein
MVSSIDISDTFHRKLLSNVDFSKVRYSVLTRKGTPFLLIPSENRATELTLGLYLPQVFKGRFAAAALKIANKLGLIKHVLPKLIVPDIETREEPETLPFTQNDIDSGRVGFLLGNPEHGYARAVAVNSGEEISVIKWSELSGAGALERECKNIELLNANKVRGVPSVVSYGRNSTSFWFETTYFPRVCVSSVCDRRAIELLQSWIVDGFVSPLENKHVASLWAMEGWAPDREELATLEGLKIRKAVVHGDFTVWNLRTGSEGLMAIDWEWAVPDGIAGLDLCYGLLQEALLKKKLTSSRALRYVRRMVDNPVCKAYLEFVGWHDCLDLWLKTGVLHLHSKRDNPELLKEAWYNNG